MGSFTVALLEALLSAGVAPERARKVVDLFDRSVDERYSLHAQVLATKRDVAELETRLTREIAETRVQIAQVNGELGARIAQVNGELGARIAQINGELGARIAESRSDLIKWTLAALTAQTALLLGAIKLF
jgi:hypothetical protein